MLWIIVIVACYLYLLVLALLVFRVFCQGAGPCWGMHGDIELHLGLGFTWTPKVCRIIAFFPWVLGHYFAYFEGLGNP